MKTLDIAGKILVTLDQTLPSEPNPTYDIVMEATNKFPSLVAKGGHIMDAWGRPIDISIAPAEPNFRIVIRSAGPDGAMHSEDDVIREEVIVAVSRAK